MTQNNDMASPPKLGGSSGLKATSGWIAGGGLLGGVGAFIGASCCVLPLVLFNIGVSSALIAKLEIFAVYKDYFFAGALLLIGAGLIISVRRGKRPNRRLIIISLVGLLLVLAAYVLPFYERELLVLLGFRNG